MMIDLKAIQLFLQDWCIYFTNAIRVKLKSRTALEIEVIAFHSQLALYQEQTLNHKVSKPRLTPAFRQLWVMISKLCSNWKSFLMVIKPEAVIGWHRTAFQLYWTKKSKPCGRPKISPTTIALIKRIHQENPLCSPERIHDQLVNLGIIDIPALKYDCQIS